MSFTPIFEDVYEGRPERPYPFSGYAGGPTPVYAFTVDMRPLDALIETAEAAAHSRPTEDALYAAGVSARATIRGLMRRERKFIGELPKMVTAQEAAAVYGIANLAELQELAEYYNWN